MRLSTALHTSILILCCSILTLNATQDSEYQSILYAYQVGNFKRVRLLQNTFYKKYPESQLMPEVKLIEVEIETDPAKAVSILRSLVSKNPSFRNRDFCIYKACEILYFTSKWKELDLEAGRGVSLFGRKSRYYPDFVFFKSKASFYMHDYESSHKKSSEVIARYKAYERYPELRVQHIFEGQKLSYNAGQYASNLKESYFELDQSGPDVSSLYLLGRHFEYKHNYNLAFSIYTELVKKYPRSPESLLAKNRIKNLSDKKPKYIANPLAQIKDANSEVLSSLSPTSDPKEKTENNYYALNIGPFYNLKAAEDLKAEFAPSFEHVYVVRRYRDFMIFLEREGSQEDIMHHKIRVAEEFGVNAQIVYITDHRGLSFVHGE